MSDKKIPAQIVTTSSIRLFDDLIIELPEPVIHTEFIGDSLIVFCENSTWELKYEDDGEQQLIVRPYREI